MSSEKISLKTITEQVDNNISSSAKKGDRGYKIFKTKNYHPHQSTEQDRTAVEAYQSILGNIKQGVANTVNSVSNLIIGKKILSNSTTNSTQNQIRLSKATNTVGRIPTKVSNSNGHNQLSNPPKEETKRCNKCTCIVVVTGNCPYCLGSKEIEIIDCDQETDKAASSKQSIDLTNSSKMNSSTTQIAASNFYSKENKSSIATRINSSLSSSSFTENGLKQEMDYLFVGTYRFLVSGYIRIENDKLILSFSSKEALNIDYRLIIRLSLCEAKTDNVKNVYIKIDFLEEAVNEIVDYIKRWTKAQGSFKYESINGHEKYFIMKLKHMQPDDSLNFRKKLKMYLQNRLREDQTTLTLFEQQREYCLTLRTRTSYPKKQKTCDTRNQDKLKNNNYSRDEPMEIDDFNSFNSSANRSCPTTGYKTRSAGIANFEKPSLFTIGRSIGSSSSVKVIDDDEIKEITKSSLSFKNM